MVRSTVDFLLLFLSSELAQSGLESGDLFFIVVVIVVVVVVIIVLETLDGWARGPDDLTCLSLPLSPPVSDPGPEAT